MAVVNDNKNKLQIHAAEMSFLCLVTGRTHPQWQGKELSHMGGGCSRVATSPQWEGPGRIRNRCWQGSPRKTLNTLEGLGLSAGLADAENTLNTILHLAAVQHCDTTHKRCSVQMEFGSTHTAPLIENINFLVFLFAFIYNSLTLIHRWLWIVK